MRAGEVDRLSPERVTLTGGRAVSIDYQTGKAPSIASRLQDFFGMTDGPRIGGGRVPLVLELLGIPFTGSPPEVLSFALRKDRVKQRLEAAGIPTPSGRILRPGDWCELPFPLIVKPVREDGSVGISRASVVRDHGELARAVHAVTTSLRQPALVEQFIDGRELNVALLGHPTPRVLPLSEIDFSTLPAEVPRIVSYEAKWASGSVEEVHFSEARRAHPCNNAGPPM